jgi:hypothetical protein
MPRTRAGSDLDRASQDQPASKYLSRVSRSVVIGYVFATLTLMAKSKALMVSTLACQLS